jgi:hypothetical protein
MPETLRYLIKMLVSKPNAGAIIVHLDLLPTLADPDNWEWKDRSRALWMPADEIWQNFRTKWYGVTESQSASPVFPSLSLEPLKPFPGFRPSTSSIFVRESYVTMSGHEQWHRKVGTGLS